MQKLSEVYSLKETSYIVRRLLNDKYSVSNVDLILKGESEVDFVKEFNNDIVKLFFEEPIQYVVGFETFCDMKFEVNKNTLIPRPETMQLVEIVCREIGNERLKVLDIGTGSGAIAVSIAAMCDNVMVSAIDISAGAIEVATRNATLNNVKINFVHGDIFLPPSELEDFDIIVSNPPYVLNSEKVVMSNNVLDYEPHTALFVEDSDPLVFYREITKFAKNHLHNGGKLFFEINRIFGKETCQLMQEFNFVNVHIVRDFNSNDRFVWSTKN